MPTKYSDTKIIGAVAIVFIFMLFGYLLLTIENIIAFPGIILISLGAILGFIIAATLISSK